VVLLQPFIAEDTSAFSILALEEAHFHGSLIMEFMTETIQRTKKREVNDVDNESMSLPIPIVELLIPELFFKYPFLSCENVELSAKGLTLCDYQSCISHEEHITLQID
jgi:hypothetical protein